jgi:hypothetical protein
MFCHLSALCFLVGVPFGSIIGPLVIWLIKREEFPFVDVQGKAALNFHISMSIYALILLFSCVGILLLPLLVLVEIIFSIMAAVKASDGISFAYPLSLPLIS